MNENKIAKIIKIYAIANAVIGAVCAFAVASEMDDIFIFLIGAFAIAVVSFAIYAVGEIIQLLHDIKINTLPANNTAQKTKTFDSTALPKL